MSTQALSVSGVRDGVFKGLSESFASVADEFGEECAQELMPLTRTTMLLSLYLARNLGYADAQIEEALKVESVKGLYETAQKELLVDSFLIKEIMVYVLPRLGLPVTVLESKDNSADELSL